MEHFLACMARKGCSASTQNQAFNAILFLDTEMLKRPLLNIQALRATRPQRVRTAPSRTEVARIIAHVDAQEEKENDYPIKLIVKLLYGCGLRVSEPLNLRIKDVELEHSRLVIRDAKGGKDRVVPLPCSLVSALQEQIRRAQKMWMRDRQKGIPVPLLDALAIESLSSLLKESVFRASAPERLTHRLPLPSHCFGVPTPITARDSG